MFFFILFQLNRERTEKKMCIQIKNAFYLYYNENIFGNEICNGFSVRAFLMYANVSNACLSVCDMDFVDIIASVGGGKIAKIH